MFITESYEANTYQKLINKYADRHDSNIYSSDVEYVHQVIDGEEVELNIYEFVERVNEQISIDIKSWKSDLEHNRSYSQPY